MYQIWFFVLVLLVIEATHWQSLKPVFFLESLIGDELVEEGDAPMRLLVILVFYNM